MFRLITISALTATAVNADNLAQVTEKVMANARNNAAISDIRRPNKDKREFKHFTMDNELKVLLVSDDQAQKTAFAMAVEAGSLADPEGIPGLAHFCEHMLFLGSKKYPDSEGFGAIMNKYDGSHNAYTDQDLTVYYNDLHLSGLEEAIDVWAQFFISPLFDEKLVDKEINAVNSEHEKNLNSQMRRMWEMMRGQGSDKKNPLSHFFTGNSETLAKIPKEKGISVVEELKKFHSSHYCPDRMNLVLVANKPMDYLEKLVRETFKDVPKHEQCISKANWAVTESKYPLAFDPTKNLGYKFTTAAVSTPQMWVMFPVNIKDINKNYAAGISIYLSYIWGDSGSHSVKKALEDENLVTDQSLWYTTSHAGVQLFLMLDLTAKGAADPDKVLHAVFAYWNEVRNNGVLKGLYQSLQGYSLAEFKWQEKGSSEMSAVSSLAASLTEHQPKDVLSGGKTIDTLDEKLMEEVVNQLKPENCNVGLAVKPDESFKLGEPDNETVFLEHFYQIHYKKEKLDEDLIEDLKNSKFETRFEQKQITRFFCSDSFFPFFCPFYVFFFDHFGVGL